MAIMIPSEIRQFDKSSLEDIMFDSLKNLSDDYYVFHSFAIVTASGDYIKESETDFLIFHKRKGIICIEAKAGQIRYENGLWLYGSGKPIFHGDGPFRQVGRNKGILIDYIKNSSYRNLLEKCRIHQAVWFPSIDIDRIKNVLMPPEAEKKLLLTKDDLDNIENALERIFSLSTSQKILSNMSDTDVINMLKHILCPQFNIVPTASLEKDLKDIRFHRMLHEQIGILNFLEEQKTASINGSAGTGKTMVAVEKAFRHANNGDKVLFLCYNKYLQLYLEQRYNHKNIDFFTIDKFVCKITALPVADYSKGKETIIEWWMNGRFPYKHVIIDEGQDFGQDSMEQSSIIDTIKSVIEEEDDDKSFYVFYDKNQLIQAEKLPGFIANTDCKVTLYRNCRNTKNIAITSNRPINNKKYKLIDNAPDGRMAKLYYCQNSENLINQVKYLLDNSRYDDTVVLTCSTEAKTILCEFIENDLLFNKYRFTTCRKFKGLEADHVIIVDVTKETFQNTNSLILYVGASRAKYNLDIVTELTDDDCKDIIVNNFDNDYKGKKARRDLKDILNTASEIV